VRTAEELGRAFPGTVVRHSGGDTVLATVPDEPALVVATPGAEPVAAGGYAAALLLDGWAMLSRPDLRVDEEALRRWLAAAALVRPSGDGGAVVVVADAEIPAVQALVRWDPATFAERELAERAALQPAARSRRGVADRFGGGTGPVPRGRAAAGVGGGAGTRGGRSPRTGDDATERLIVRVPRTQGRELAAGAACRRRRAQRAQGRWDPSASRSTRRARLDAGKLA
jgi:primosomal protein N' (replication factor Y)